MRSFEHTGIIRATARTLLVGLLSLASPVVIAGTPAEARPALADARSAIPHRHVAAPAPRVDFNGDGYADLAIGSFGEKVGGKTGAGSVNVIYGSASGLQITGTGGPDDQYWAQNSPGMPGYGPGKNDGFGSSEEAADFNGDGYADLAIAARGATCSGTIGEAGAVYVLYGGPSGLSTTGAQFWTEDSPNIGTSCVQGDHFGSSLIHGDFNRDGYADLGIGTDFKAVSGLDKAGAGSVLYGSASGLQSTGTGGPAAQFWNLDIPGVAGSAAAGDRWGRELASADFNNDGYADMAIDADFKKVGAASHGGTVSILYGSATGLQADGTGGPPSQFWTENTRGMGDGGAQTDDRFGASLAGGDINGDGYGDLAIGIRLKDVGTIVDAGAIAVLYGSSTGLQDNGRGGPDDQFFTQDQFQGPGAQTGAWFGYSVSVGNFNGDAYGDVVAGARFEDVNTVVDAGAVNVVNGSATGLVTAGNQYWNQSSPGMAGRGTQMDAEFGLWSANGDFNGDGIDDTTITAWLEDVSGVVDAGAVNTLYGSGTGLSTAGSQFWNQGSAGMAGQGLQTGAEFGWEDGST